MPFRTGWHHCVCASFLDCSAVHTCATMIFLLCRYWQFQVPLRSRVLLLLVSVCVCECLCVGTITEKPQTRNRCSLLVICVIFPSTNISTLQLRKCAVMTVVIWSLTRFSRMSYRLNSMSAIEFTRIGYGLNSISAIEFTRMGYGLNSLSAIEFTRMSYGLNSISVIEVSKKVTTVIYGA